MRQKIVDRDTWLAARKALLSEEKAFTRQRDALSAKRRALPWVEVDKTYEFESEQGPLSLAQLFAGHKQLIVYHFMFAADWQEGCPSCSFWADNFNGLDVHLNHRDTHLVAVSRAPLDRLLAYKKRMGWDFNWVSSLNNDFNFDYQVSFESEQGGQYNYRPRQSNAQELPGISVFIQQQGKIFHSYSCYARGLDMLNSAYHFLDLTPQGRNEEDLPFTMAWLKRHDAYD